MPSPTYPSRYFICNSCNLIGDAFSYACAQCEFDLHVHCALTSNFNSQRGYRQSTIKHFSHPHALKQMEINAKACSACERRLIGPACSCTFNLHKSCFDSPREIRHKSHLQHALTLHSSRGFTCGACLKDGRAFAYGCAACCYHLHIDCVVKWPETVTRPDHDHSLKLCYSSPYAELGEHAVFICSVCMRPAHNKAWVYYCGVCDFGTHLECEHSQINNNVNFSAGENEEELSRLLRQKVSLDERMRKAEQEEAYMKRMEIQAELRRRRDDLAMQRFQQTSDSIDLLGRF